MKITRTSKEASALRMAQRTANMGCDKCPCCGETKKSMEYIRQGITNKGILTGIERTWNEGFLGLIGMKCDCYSCLTCGAKWESEPYRWA